jgi:hypothetical protein
MLTLSPLTRTIIGAVITVCIGISAGSVHLTNAIPEAWIPAVVAWSGLIAFFGSAIQTGMQGLGLTTANKVAAAAADPNVKQIVTTSEVANSPAFAPNDKVVSK